LWQHSGIGKTMRAKYEKIDDETPDVIHLLSHDQKDDSSVSFVKKKGRLRWKFFNSLRKRPSPDVLCKDEDNNVLEDETIATVDRQVDLDHSIDTPLNDTLSFDDSSVVVFVDDDSTIEPNNWKLQPQIVENEEVIVTNPLLGAIIMKERNQIVGDEVIITNPLLGAMIMKERNRHFTSKVVQNGNIEMSVEVEMSTSPFLSDAKERKKVAAEVDMIPKAKIMENEETCIESYPEDEDMSQDTTFDFNNPRKDKGTIGDMNESIKEAEKSIEEAFEVDEDVTEALNFLYSDFCDDKDANVQQCQAHSITKEALDGNETEDIGKSITSQTYPFFWRSHPRRGDDSKKNSSPVSVVTMLNYKEPISPSSVILEAISYPTTTGDDDKSHSTKDQNYFPYFPEKASSFFSSPSRRSLNTSQEWSPSPSHASWTKTSTIFKDGVSRFFPDSNNILTRVIKRKISSESS